MADNTTPTLPAKTPDITSAQILALLQPLGSALIVLGVFHITDNQLQVVLLAVSGLLSLVLLIADALIRRGRSKAIAALATPDIMSLAVDAVLKAQEVAKALEPATHALGVLHATDPGTAPPAFQPGAFGDDPAATHAAGEAAPPLTDGPPPLAEDADRPARPEQA